VPLDHTKGCVNFRDVGDWVNEIAGRRLLPTGRIFRGGRIDFVASPLDIGSPGTVFNLRNSPDPEPKRFSDDHFHFPVSNDLEKYDTAAAEVRSWLQDIAKTVEILVTRFPLFIHCNSGKDRTGVVVASLLCILGIDREVIVEEYLLSEGDVRREWIGQSLDGIPDPVRYFRRVDLGTVRRKLAAPDPEKGSA
jgi:protein-tyrosine phosphatase